MKKYPWPENIFKDFEIEQIPGVNNTPAKDFVISFHYSKSLARGCTRNFVLKSQGKIYGVAMFGIPTGKNGNLDGTVECKRFVLMREAPKNVASWFMAKCLKVLQQDKSISQIISYADELHGHTGIIYQASNFEYLGLQAKKGQAINFNGKLIHLRIAYQKTKTGEYTKTAKEVSVALKEGRAKYITLPKKHIYCYMFR